MNSVAIVGKFPPIQGGVSASTYWTAIALTEAGYDVHVITNSHQCEPEFTQYFLESDTEKFIERTTSSCLTVHQISTLPEGQYIPWARPYLSQLLGQLVGLTQQFTFRCVLGWYMEPYGMAAALSRSAIGAPVLLKHAGSDLGRLFLNQELQSAYRWAFSCCSGVLTTATNQHRLIEAGVAPEKIILLRAPRLHYSFTQGISTLPVPK
jgi:hypothetical protein